MCCSCEDQHVMDYLINVLSCFEGMLQVSITKITWVVQVMKEEAVNSLKFDVFQLTFRK